MQQTGKKLYLSVDMEGVTGVTAWEDVRKGTADHSHFRQQMTREVLAICETAQQQGIQEILVKDAHATARNLVADDLPPGVRIFSGWARDPQVMMSGLDKSFSAVMFSGYHAGAYCDGNPLAHTMNSERIFSFKINGHHTSEFLMNTYIAAYHGVPVVAVTGDEAVCNHAQDHVPGIVTIPVKKGVGGGVISLAPQEALSLIREGAAKALTMDPASCLVKLPSSFQVEICFKDYLSAYRASFYKGVKLLDAHTIGFECDDYYEVLRTYFFC